MKLNCLLFWSCCFFLFSSILGQSWMLVNSGVSSSAPEARRATVGVTYRDSFIFWGGIDNSSYVFNDVWKFNYTTNSWTLLNSGTYPAPATRCFFFLFLFSFSNFN